MIDVPSGHPSQSGIARIGAQPIALAAVALVLVLTGAGSIALWRAATGTSTEPDRVISARQIQLRAAEGVRTTGREDQGAGADPARIDRPVAGAAGPGSGRQTPARGAAE